MDDSHWAVVEAQKLRGLIEPIKEEVFRFKANMQTAEQLPEEDKGEQIANIMLAYRHLEDAKMRLGKVIQATQGKSVYDN